jgi:PAS domain S-box-containing protein
MMKKPATLSSPPELVKQLGVALLYAVTSWLVQANFATAGQATLLFLPSGIALAALILGGPRYALAIFLGASLSNLLFVPVLWASAGMGVGAALGALASVWVIKQSGRFDASLPSLNDLIRLGFGGVVGASISALTGATLLVLSGGVGSDDYLGSALTWGMGDLLGIVLITPLILVWWPTAANPLHRPSTKELAEAALILGATALAGSVIFLHAGLESSPAWLHEWVDSTPQGYWMFLYVTWAAMRLGTRGTSLALLVVALLGFNTVYQGDAHPGLHWTPYLESNFWFFSIVLSLVGMTLAIYIAASKKTALSLQNREAAIHREHRSFIAALNNHAIVATTDVQGRITFVNDKLCELSGYSRDELLGQNHRLLNSGLHPKSFFQNLYQTLRAGQVWHGEVRNRAKDGSLYWVQTTITPFMGADGRPVKYVAIRTNITQRKLAEQELQHHRDHLQDMVMQKTADLLQNERKLADILENVDACIYLKDTEGRYLFANRPVCDLFGVPMSSILGQRDEKFFDAATCEKIRNNDSPVLDRGETFREEETILNLRNGHRSTYLSVKIPLFNTAGHIYALCGISTDITERIRIEEAAHAANQAKSEFLANMSHEIRTPMNGVVGMIDLLQQTDLSSKQHRMVETMHNSSMVLLTILNDILDLSKIEAGKLAIEYLPTHLRDLTEEVAQLMVSKSSDEATDTLVTVSPELPAWISTDPTRLRQILMNLLGNAFKFTPSTPAHPARVSLTVTPCTLASGGPGVRWCVTDNGIGISPQAQALLFQPFTQADASTARKFGGTGLGLSISQRLVTLMEGQISVQSTLGEGSAFTIELPLQAAEPARRMSPDAGQPLALRHPRPGTPAPSLEEAQRTGRLVLLAEDNETNRDVIQEQLRLLGYASESADDGVAALALWRTGRFALLLTDCHMPNMDGFELTEAIRQAEAPGTRQPIVAITANARQGEAERCRARGMDDYLAKPVRLKELGPMMARWMPPPSSPTEPAVWDATTLPELVGDNPAMHRRLLERFLLNAQTQVTGIGTAAQAGDEPTLSGLTHTLKSAARSVGALRLGELSAALETAGLTGDVASYTALAQGLPQVLADAQAHITAHLAAQASS